MIKIDLKNMMQPRLQNGLKSEDLDGVKPKLAEAFANFNREKTNFGFTQLLNKFQELKPDLEKIDNYSSGMDTVVVIGIGGSDLGARAIFKALKHHFYNQLAEAHSKRKLYFTGDTTDPDELSNLSDVLNLSKTLFLAVSKSGNTIEQASAFIYFRDLIRQMLGKGSELNHFVFLTDPESGTLHELSKEFGYKTIDIPSDVGGRFSVLSSVGMIPAHLIGLKVEEFLNGAADLDKELSVESKLKEELLKLIALQYLYYKNGKNISVLMPYKYSLSEFAKWFRQLWAESLGKRLNTSGQEVFEGITPIAALGPTDQHSQLQLYNEGPNDKVFTFINVETPKVDLSLPGNIDLRAFDFLSGHKFQKVLDLEMQTTIYSLTKNQRPNATITLPSLDEYHLGQLFYFFEVGVVLMGSLLDINPYDQPGVELSKNAMYGVLRKNGFEKDKANFENFQNL